MWSIAAQTQGVIRLRTAIGSEEEVATETEVKVMIDDADAFCERLTPFRPEAISLRHFEDNYLLDFSDLKLKSAQCALRVRFAEGRSVLTFKGRPQPGGVFKSREELELEVADGDAMLQILERLGMNVGFRYQKHRREFAIGDVHVAVDETPVGTYVEFEGTEEGIRRLTALMGIAETEFIRLSYYSLYLEACRNRGEAPGFMVF